MDNTRNITTLIFQLYQIALLIDLFLEYLFCCNYYSYEKLCDNKYCIVGYSTLYNYYAYFDMIRPRLR